MKKKAGRTRRLRRAAKRGQLYVYLDQQGRPVFEIRRRHPKGFSMARINEDGSRTSGPGCMEGVELVLFNLPGVLESAREESWLLIVEGEKDVLAALERGWPATTNPMGAGKWRDSYAQLFLDAATGKPFVDRVLIVADRDPAGVDHALDIERSFLQLGVGDVKVVRSAAGNDLSDHLDAGFGLEDLVPLPRQVAVTSEKRSPKVFASDMANADLFAQDHANDLRYDAIEGVWLNFGETHWAKVPFEIAMAAAKQTAQRMLTDAVNAPDSSDRDARFNWAKRSQQIERVRAMVKMAQSDPRLLLDSSVLDRNEDLLNCKNGTLDLRTGVLRPHDRGDFITKIAPVEFDEQARSALFTRVLRQAIPDAAVRRYLKRAAGATLLGRSGGHVFLIHGPTRTAKGTIQHAIASTLGTYAMTGWIDDLGQRPGRGPQPELVRLRGARMVCVYETGRELRLDAALIKTITGDDPISPRDLYKSAITFVPSFTLWLATNHRPRLPADDGAIWERVREIPFAEQIPERERDPSVRQRLADPEESGAAVLAWMVRGLAEYVDGGLKTPSLVRRTTSQYREAMTPLSDFFRDCCEFADEAWMSTARLRAKLDDWCRTHRVPPMSDADLSKALRERGLRPTRRRVRKGCRQQRGWHGVKLIEV